MEKMKLMPFAPRGKRKHIERKRAYRGARMRAPSEAWTQSVLSPLNLINSPKKDEKEA